MIKLIVTDMDGTFLNERKEISDEFWGIFEELKEKKIKFVAASGRQYQNLKGLFERIENDMIFVADNGSYIVEKEKETFSRELSREAVEKYIKIGREIETSNMVLCGKKSAYIENTEEKFYTEVKKYYASLEIVDDLLKVENDEIIKIAVCDEDTEKNVYPLLKNETEVQIVVSGQIWLDISHLESNKGLAIEFIQKEHGISYDETMLFGDYLNDYEMMKKGRYSFAMLNAHEKLKEISNYVTEKDNNHDGVLEEIKKILK